MLITVHKRLHKRSYEVKQERLKVQTTLVDLWAFVWMGVVWKGKIKWDMNLIIFTINLNFEKVQWACEITYTLFVILQLVFDSGKA